jgi:hypothetical protein
MAGHPAAKRRRVLQFFAFTHFLTQSRFKVLQETL